MLNMVHSRATLSRLVAPVRKVNQARLYRAATNLFDILFPMIVLHMASGFGGLRFA